MHSMRNLFAALLLALAAAQADGYRFEATVHVGEVEQLPLKGLITLRVEGSGGQCDDTFVVNETPESAQELLPNQAYTTTVELNCTAPQIGWTQVFWTERTSVRAVADRVLQLLPNSAPKAITVKQIDFDPVYLSNELSREERLIEFIPSFQMPDYRVENGGERVFALTKVYRPIKLD